MGADLYINSLEELVDKEAPYPDWKNTTDEERREAYKKRDEAQEKHNSYFRDSYNYTNVLWKFGLSYWQSLKDLLDDENNMSPENVKVFKQMLVDKQFEFFKTVRGITTESLIEDHCGETDDPKGWQDYFIEKKDRLFAFLDKAIEVNSAIYFST